MSIEFPTSAPKGQPVAAPFVVNPAMVSLARESRGLSQRELAGAIGATQATISKYESGQLVVAPHDLPPIASATRYRPSFFYQKDTVYGLTSTFLFHRQRARIPLKVQSRVQAEVNVRRMQAARLLKGADWEHDHLFPPLSAHSYDGKVELVAQEVRRLWNIPSGPVQDLTAAIENAGGIVFMVDFATNLIDGAHLWVPGLPPMFFMNSKVSGERHRYNLAHEVGHAIMHHGEVSLEDAEGQANRFAAEFLMPRADIRRDLASLNIEKAARLKAFWKVSMAALIRRGHDLHQMSDSTYSRLFRMLSASGDRMEEPWPIEHETPKVLERLVAFHRDKLGMSEDELADLMLTDKFGPIDIADVPKLRLTGTLFDEKA